jgi:hypothetical protein
MAESVLVAYDCSGSTRNDEKYHEISKQVTSKYRNATFVVWNNTYKKVPYTYLARINDTLDGNGGTLVENVAQAIIDLQFVGKLVLITDGQVCSSGISYCDQLLERHNNITSSEIHIVGEYANMSVSCPFTRMCPHVVYEYQHNETFPTTTNITKDDLDTLAMIDSIQTLAEFDKKYESIHKAITARLMGKQETDQKIHDQVVRLKNRIAEDVSKQHTSSSSDAIVRLTALCKSGFDDALELYKTIVQSYYNQNDVSHEQKLSNLLNITKGGLWNVFSHRLRRAESISEQPVQDIDLSEKPHENSIVCPITFDDENEVAVLIKAVAKGLLETHLEPNQIEDVINCPLNALNYANLVQGIKDSLDVAMSVAALKTADALGTPFETSPLTRAEVSGAIYMGTHETQVNASNWAIGNLLVGEGSKKVGNMDLWYAVFYFVLKQVERFADIMPFATTHMKYRLHHGSIWASMSGQPKYLNVRVPLGVACWMVVSSPMLNLPPNRDMIRAHVWHTNALFELNELFGGNVGDHEQKLRTHATRLKTLYKMLTACKKDKHFHARSMVHYQRCIRLKDGTLIPIDGVCETPNYELAALSMKVHQNLAAEMIDLDVDWVPPTVQPAINWPEYGLNTQTVDHAVRICSATARPYYRLQNNTTWKDNFKKEFKFDLDRCISLHSWYINYVQKYKCYPDFDKFVKYAYQRCLNKQVNTLPAPVAQFIHETIESYQPLTDLIDADEFVRRADASAPIAERIKMESMCV